MCTFVRCVFGFEGRRNSVSINRRCFNHVQHNGVRSLEFVKITSAPPSTPLGCSARYLHYIAGAFSAPAVLGIAWTAGADAEPLDLGTLTVEPARVDPANCFASGRVTGRCHHRPNSARPGFKSIGPVDHAGELREKLRPHDIPRSQKYSLMGLSHLRRTAVSRTLARGC